MKTTIIVILAVVIVIFFIHTYRKLVKENMKVEEIYDRLDNMLQKRYDLIPDLIEEIRGKTQYEEELLQQVIKLRTLGHQIQISIRQKWENELTEIISKILQENKITELEKFKENNDKIERMIQMGITSYNSSARDYNDYRNRRIPKIIATITGNTEKELIEINYVK